MEDQERDEFLMRLIEHPESREEALSDNSISKAERTRLLELLQLSDVIWASAQEPPPLEQDPVAAMLGLIPETDCQLEPAALSRARKGAKMSPSQVASRLQQRGWEVTTGDIFRWETRTASDVPPAVIQVLAEILETAPEKLTAESSPSPLPTGLNAIRDNAFFKDLVDRWAKAAKVSRAVATSALESRILSTVHRGDHPDIEQLLKSLEVLVTTVENQAPRN